MLYKRLSFFIFLFCSHQTLAMDSINDANRIDSLAAKLRAIDSIQFCAKYDDDSCSAILDYTTELFQTEYVDLAERPKDMSQLYRSVKLAGGGGGAHVWEATLAKDRPLAGLKAGDVIAIRVRALTGPISVTEIKKLDNSIVGFEALICLSRFKNLKTGEQPITDYFPNFYGVYHGRKMPPSLVEEKYPEFLEDRGEWYFRYEEMEFVDTTFAQRYCIGNKIPDSVLFEFIYGEWAGRFFLWGYDS